MSTTGAQPHLLERELDPRTHIVQVRGDASLVTRDLRSRLAAATAAGRLTAIVDFSDATGVTSPVAWELSRANARLSWRGGQLLVVADAARLTPLLDAFALHRAPSVVSTFAAALAAANVSVPAEPGPGAPPEPRSGNGGPLFSWRRHEDLPATWSFALGGGPEAPRVARAAVRRLVRQRVDDQAEGAALLLVSEAVTNSVLHGGADENEAVELKVSVTETDVRIEVADPGGGFTPPERPKDPLSEHGRGLPMIRSLSRTWGVDAAPDGCVWFELARQKYRGQRAPLRNPPDPVVRSWMLRAAGTPGSA